MKSNFEDRKDRVRPTDFFSTDHEKTKLNWFLYEYALGLYSSITHDKRLLAKLRHRNINSARIAAFAVYHAKSMRTKILDRVSGRTPVISLTYKPIEAFFPAIGDLLVDQLLAKASEAWDSHTEACIMCSTRCISEKEQRASMFDDPLYMEE